jgi:hypothetical protein
LVLFGKGELAIDVSAQCRDIGPMVCALAELGQLGARGCLGSVKMSPFNGSVNLSPPQAVCGSPLSLHEEVVVVAVGNVDNPAGLPKVLWAGPQGLSISPACPQPS